jgi:hypothetical protein
MGGAVRVNGDTVGSRFAILACDGNVSGGGSLSSKKAVGFAGLRRRKRRRRARMTAINAKPPSTPPIMGPMGTELWEGSGVVEVEEVVKLVEAGDKVKGVVEVAEEVDEENELMPVWELLLPDAELTADAAKIWKVAEFARTVFPSTLVALMT